MNIIPVQVKLRKMILKHILKQLITMTTHQSMQQQVT